MGTAVRKLEVPVCPDVGCVSAAEGTQTCAKNREGRTKGGKGLISSRTDRSQSEEESVDEPGVLISMCRSNRRDCNKKSRFLNVALFLIVEEGI